MKHIRKQTMILQTLTLTGANLIVRLMGFVMRIWLSRTLGAEAMGIMELAGSAHMLWLAPVTSGLPMAVSRHTALASAQNDDLRMKQTLLAGKRLANRIAWCMLPVLLIASPWIAKLLGDSRCLPTLLAYLPCLPILGLSAVYNGYCYGSGNTFPPAISELAEQSIRFALCFGVLTVLPPMRAAYSAAVPAAAVAVGEGLGLLLVIWMLRGVLPIGKDRSVKIPKGLTRKLWRLAFPMTCMRVCNTLMRTANAVLIPARLRFSGLTAAEATAQLGMFQGMAMSLIMLPAVFTGAVAMVAAPAITARESDPEAMRRLLRRVMPPTVLISVAAMAALWLSAPLVANRLYRQPALEGLLRTLCPCVVLMGVQQVVGGLLSGLGQQRRALTASLAGAILTIALNYTLAALPTLRLTGVAYAYQAGQTLTLLMCLRYLMLATSRMELRAQRVGRPAHA
jgi:stage V sporulation protein B